jgi:hypothetical protein
MTWPRNAPSCAPQSVGPRAVRLLPWSDRNGKDECLQALRCLFDNDRMELAGLEPATSWVRLGLASHSSHRDLQGFWSALAEVSPVGIPTDCRRLPGVCPPKRRFGGKGPGPELAASLELAAGDALVALWRAWAVRSHPADCETSGRDGAVVRPQKQEDSRADSGPNARLDLVPRDCLICVAQDACFAHRSRAPVTSGKCPPRTRGGCPVSRSSTGTASAIRRRGDSLLSPQ